MATYDARLRLDWTNEPPISVLIDVTDERITLKSGDNDIADWALSEIRISPMPDGFHIRAEGEEVVLDVTDDARFALDLGLRHAHPMLRRRMSALLRQESSD